MIDLHCHLLPGIDDGPATLEESLELCRIAAADGITHAIVTPHIHPGRWENTRESIGKGCQNLQQLLNRENIPLQLGFAGEVRLTDQIMRQVDNDEIPFYGEVDGYQIMLLEFPHGHIVPGSDNLVNWLLDRKIRPLIAHPERNKQVMRSPEDILPFVASGCWLQLTAGSFCGQFGDRARRVADQFLQEKLVSVVASDGHNNKSRPPSLAIAYQEILKKFGEQTAYSLVVNAPREIAADQFAESTVAA